MAPVAACEGNNRPHATTNFHDNRSCHFRINWVWPTDGQTDIGSVLISFCFTQNLKKNGKNWKSNVKHCQLSFSSVRAWTTEGTSRADCQRCLLFEVLKKMVSAECRIDVIVVVCSQVSLINTKYCLFKLFFIVWITATDNLEKYTRNPYQSISERILTVKFRSKLWNMNNRGFCCKVKDTRSSWEAS